MCLVQETHLKFGVVWSTHIQEVVALWAPEKRAQKICQICQQVSHALPDAEIWLAGALWAS